MMELFLLLAWISEIARLTYTCGTIALALIRMAPLARNPGPGQTFGRTPTHRYSVHWFFQSQYCTLYLFLPSFLLDALSVGFLANHNFEYTAPDSLSVHSL